MQTHKLHFLLHYMMYHCMRCKQRRSVMRQRMEAVVSFASGEANAWGRAGGVADSPCIHVGSDDAAFR